MRLWFAFNESNKIGNNMNEKRKKKQEKLDERFQKQLKWNNSR